MADLKIVQFPRHSLEDVAQGLRALADRVEAGEFRNAFNCAWVIDCGGGEVSVGLLGSAGETGPVAHFLFALGMRKIERLDA